MKRSNGFVLIATLLVMVVVAILVFGTAFTAVIDRQVSANQRGATDAYYVAKAGIDKYKTVAFQAFRFYLENIELYHEELRNTNPACGNFLEIGLDLNRDGEIDVRNGQQFPVVQFDQGTATVTFSTAGRYIILTSVGRAGRSRATVQLVAEPRNAGALSYAIFAGGGGFGNRKINANAQVYGGVYVEGSGSTTESVINANGNFAIHNFYTVQTLENLISWPNNRTETPQDFLNLASLNQEDLCARLRVQNGFIDLSGNMSLGDSTAPTGFKRTLAGVHVGAHGDANDIRSQGNATIHADVISGFDLQGGIPFPSLDGSACAEDPNLTLRQCLSNTASFTLTAGVAPTLEQCADDLAKPSVTTIVNNQPTLNFGAGQSQGNNHIPGSADIDCTTTDANGNPVGFTYTYDPTTRRGTLEVFGLVNFRGYNLRFAQNVDVRFSDRATFFVERLNPGAGSGGSITIDGDILPRNNFPNVDVLGLIAERRVHVTGRNQNRLETNGQAVAGVLYAGERAVVEGGTVFGSVIGAEFCSAENNANPPACQAGGNAAVVHVPGIEYNLAPGFEFIPSVPTYRIASYERR